MRRTPDEQWGWEFHRWQGFTRFRINPDGTWTARIAPSCDILESLAAYFSRRLRGKSWVIIDETRHQAAVSREDNTWGLVPWQESQPPSAAPDMVETLWQAYFDGIAIKERKNSRLQRQHLPKRYQPYLVEKIC